MPKPEPKVDRSKQIEDNRMQELLAMDAQRARESELLKQEMQSAARAGALDAYQNAIRQRVRQNIVLPPSVSGNPEATFVVDQLPDGTVMELRLKKSTGNAALDEAIERAIRKSSPLPLPTDKALFARTLELKFRPLE